MLNRILCLLTVLLLLSGCSSAENNTATFQLYYARTSNTELDSALEGVTWEGSREIPALFAQLCATPAEEGLSSLIPSRTTLKSWTLEEEILHLDLSAEFGTLTGIQLTMASYCLVLTYCQLDTVSGVVITADGEALLPNTILTPQQVMLDGGEGDTSTLPVTLYFPLSDGSGMGSETRILTITENRTRAESILDALCAGPESRDLSAFLPDSDQGITLWTQDGICYVNLTEEWQQELEANRTSLLLELTCVVNSLAQLDGVDSVQFLMDGAAIEAWSDLGGDFPLLPNTDD